MEAFAKETLPISLEDEMRRSYLDYAMSVIVGRALPDARDGLKPVHRRVLFAMHELSNDWNKPYKKSARIVGDVIGKYHPHGDTAVYDTIVRMAQDFSLRYMLVDGQGNFGSVDGDNAAAMRYTEVRMARIGHELLADIDKETVDFGPNYDGSEEEPLVMPSRIPNLLINGSSGIAVGMATNIPPHNLSEVVDACLALLEQPETTIDELIDLLPAPDFPTAGIIYGVAGVREGYRTGRGRVHDARQDSLRGHGQGQPAGDHHRRTAVPGEQADAARKDRRAGQREADRRDFRSARRVRQVGHARGDRAEARRSARSGAQLPVQADAAAGHLRHEHGRAGRWPAAPAEPQADARVFSLASARGLTRRTVFELRKARERAHIQEGLAVALDNVDEIIALIKAAPTPADARRGLMASTGPRRRWPRCCSSALDATRPEGLAREFGLSQNGYLLSEAQAQAILECACSA
jgi:DNA gyrase subunit A